MAFSDSSTLFITPSAAGERHILPRHTKSILRGLFGSFISLFLDLVEKHQQSYEKNNVSTTCNSIFSLILHGIAGSFAKSDLFP